MSAPQQTAPPIHERIDSLNWNDAAQSLSERGYAVTAPFLAPDECAFQAIISTARYRPVKGSRRYYRVTLRHAVTRIHSGKR